MARGGSMREGAALAVAVLFAPALPARSWRAPPPPRYGAPPPLPYGEPPLGYERGMPPRPFPPPRLRHCRGDPESTIIGAIAGGLLGNLIAGRGSRGIGTFAGAGGGALAGHAIGRNCR